MLQKEISPRPQASEEECQYKSDIEMMAFAPKTFQNMYESIVNKLKNKEEVTNEMLRIFVLLSGAVYVHQNIESNANLKKCYQDCKSEPKRKILIQNIGLLILFDIKTEGSRAIAVDDYLGKLAHSKCANSKFNQDYKMQHPLKSIDHSVFLQSFSNALTEGRLDNKLKTMIAAQIGEEDVQDAKEASQHENITDNSVEPSLIELWNNIATPEQQQGDEYWSMLDFSQDNHSNIFLPNLPDRPASEIDLDDAHDILESLENFDNLDDTLAMMPIDEG